MESEPLNMRPSIAAGILRAVPLAKCVEYAGQVWESNVGDASHYDMSRPAEQIDCFLSHSWRASRWLKYLALVLYFRAPAAVLAANLAAFACLALQYYRVLDFPRLTVEFVQGEGTLVAESGVLCQSVPPLVFLAVLFCSPIGNSATCFLDKCCIHQTDAEIKMQGILSLGGFLKSSKAMLLLWNADYFERLWCVYEVACFLHLKDSDHQLVFLPTTQSAYVLGSFAWLAFMLLECNAVQQKGWQWSKWEGVPLVQMAILLVAYGAYFMFYKTRVKDLQEMKRQLEGFSVCDAKCFDEEDKRRISASIAAWQERRGADDETFLGSAAYQRGLDSFDESVRKDLSQQLLGIAGTPTQLPYAVILMTLQPVLWFGLDYIAYAPTLDLALRWLLMTVVLNYALFPLLNKLWVLFTNCALYLEEKCHWLILASAGSVFFLTTNFSVDVWMQLSVTGPGSVHWPAAAALSAATLAIYLPPALHGGA